MGIKFITRSDVSDEVQVLVDGTLSKSVKIRTLYGMGIPKVQISELLNIRYQHVRNVLVNLPKKTS